MEGVLATGGLTTTENIIEQSPTATSSPSTKRRPSYSVLALQWLTAVRRQAPRRGAARDEDGPGNKIHSERNFEWHRHLLNDSAKENSIEPARIE